MKRALHNYISNTSPFQYLHQLGCLEILPALMGSVLAPTAVQDELQAGLRLGCDVPDLSTLPWVTLRTPVSAPALPLAADLGRGESAVLALALELESPMVILDDGLGRHVAEALKIRLTGTLGLLLDGKKAGIIPAVKPLLDQLDNLRFRVSPRTRAAILKLANE